MLTKANILERADLGEPMVWFADALPDATYRWCDGSPQSTTDLPLLFAKIGYTYGGSGGTFYLPDGRGSAWGGAGTSDDSYGVTLTHNAHQGTQSVRLMYPPAHTHSQGGSHNHFGAGGTRNVVHTHYMKYDPHAPNVDQVINQADTNTQSYYTFQAYHHYTVNGVLTTEYPGITVGTSTTGAYAYNVTNHPRPTAGSWSEYNFMSESADYHPNMMPWLAVKYCIKVTY